MKSIAIILVNWNGWKHTKQCLESLRAATYRNTSIIIVDNGSISCELENLRAIKDIHLIENSINLGFTGGNNVGIDYAYEQGFDIIMLLNNDTIVDPNFLEPVIEALRNEDVGAVQPLIFSMQEPEKIWSAGGGFNPWLGLPYTIGEGQTNTSKYDKPYKAKWLTGCCMAFRREMVDDVGLLDNRFFALCEDVDWSFRAAKIGRELIVVPRSIVYHFQGASTTSEKKSSEGYRSPFRQYLNVRNHLLIVRWHLASFFKPTAMIFHGFRIALFLGYFLLRGRWKKIRYTLEAVSHGMGRVSDVDPSKLA